MQGISLREGTHAGKDRQGLANEMLGSGWHKQAVLGPSTGSLSSLTTTLNSFLERLGLTEYEAKTLSALFKLHEAEAPDISRQAQVPKTRVYDVLDRLTKKGLVIEIRGRPKKYMCIEPSKVFHILIEEKKNELASLEKEADALKETVTMGQEDAQTERVMKVKDKQDFMKILGQEIDSANNSVHCLAHVSKEHHIIKEHLARAASRNVEVKLIGQISEETSKLSREFSQVGISMRDFEHGVNAYIIDGKKVVLALSDFRQAKPEYHFTIWPDNKPMANALSKYFEHAWEEGKDV